MDSETHTDTPRLIKVEQEAASEHAYRWKMDALMCADDLTNPSSLMEVLERLNHEVVAAMKDTIEQHKNRGKTFTQ